MSEKAFYHSQISISLLAASDLKWFCSLSNQRPDQENLVAYKKKCVLNNFNIF